MGRDGQQPTALPSLLSAQAHQTGATVPLNHEQQVIPPTGQTPHPASLQALFGELPTAPHKPKPRTSDKSVSFASNSHRQVRVHNWTYHTFNAKHADTKYAALVDRGANGGIAGDDVYVHSLSDHTVNVTGIKDHQMPDLCIGTFLAVTRTNYGRSCWSSISMPTMEREGQSTPALRWNPLEFK